MSSGDPPTTGSTRAPSPETEGEVVVHSPRCWSPSLQPLFASHQDRVEATIDKPAAERVVGQPRYRAYAPYRCITDWGLTGSKNSPRLDRTKVAGPRLTEPPLVGKGEPAASSGEGSEGVLSAVCISAIRHPSDSSPWSQLWSSSSKSA